MIFSAINQVSSIIGPHMTIGELGSVVEFLLCMQEVLGSLAGINFFSFDMQQ